MTFPPDVNIVPVHISSFIDFDALPEVDGELRGVASLLDGTLWPWPEPAKRRTLAAVRTRLGEWASPAAPRRSILFYLGHGESDGNDAWLAAQDTRSMRPDTAISPAVFAQAIRAEWATRRHDETAWTLIVIEACRAGIFATRLNALLASAADVPRRLAVIGVGGAGSTFLGAFRQALAATLASYTVNDELFDLSETVAQLQRRLHDTAVWPFWLHEVPLVPRRHPLPSSLTMPMDVYADVLALVHNLPADERQHFLPKAQSAEQGEPGWFFVGRERERQAIIDWLRSAAAGLLVVTGPAGGGKSALLGNLLVHTNPALRKFLIEAGDFEDLPAEQLPPDNVFDVVLHLTGLTVGDVVDRLAGALGAAPADPGSEIRSRIDALIDHLQGLGRRTTILADALDEAATPTVLAGSVFQRIAHLPDVAVVIGTRRTAGPNENLLDALNVRPETPVITVDRDPEALETYIRRRLGSVGHALIEADTVTETARTVAAQPDKHFLFARLVIHEILANTDLAATDHHENLLALLTSSQESVFATSIRRLTAARPAAEPLLEALALSQGRGLPRADGVWLTVAQAIRPDLPITEDDVDYVLRDAAPYIMLDAEDHQSVYRLAHRELSAHFLATHGSTGAMVGT